MDTIYRHVLEKGYPSLLKPDVVAGLLLIFGIILLQSIAPSALPIDASYIPWLGLAIALLVVLRGYGQWEAKVCSLRRLHMDLARSTLIALTDATGQVDELLALLERCKVIEEVDLPQEAEQLAQHSYTKLLLVTRQDEERLLSLSQEVLDNLKKAIKDGETIGAEVNKAITQA